MGEGGGRNENESKINHKEDILKLFELQFSFRGAHAN